MRRRQAERSDTTRRAIVEAACELFRDQGYVRTSIEQIAEKAGMSKGAVYHHYRDKTEVLAAVYEDLCRTMAGRLLASVRPDTDPVDVLKACAQQLLREYVNSDYRQVALVDSPAGLGWERWRAIDAAGGGFGLLRQGLAAAAEAGAISPDHLEERAHLLMAAITEAALLIARSATPRKTRAVMIGLVDQQLEELRIPTR
jgi:AcrR family transcriptional regulator